MTDQPCKTSLRSEEPASADAIGGHKPVAELLAKTVVEDEGGKAIAIIGSYGSGKSTVVQLFRDELQRLTSTRGQVNSHVFSFDAWSHQGDPLRRSFLEELRQSLVDIKWLTSEQLSDEMDALAQRRQSTKTDSSPVLTVAGNIVALLTLFVPLGLAVLSKAIWTDNVNAVHYDPRLIAIGMFFTLVPVLAAVVISFKMGKGWPALELLWHTTRTTTSSNSVSTPDPTSVEFRALFRRLMKLSLYHPRRRFVIVLDNLDRLDPAEAKTIFATMRTFFDRSNKQEEWDKQLWLIVPFEPSWAGRIVATSGVDASAIMPGDAKSESFLAKSFQIQVHVSEPILASWKKFIADELAQALPAHMDVRDIVVRVYANYVADSDIVLSPRIIKQFVNRLVILHREWQHDIPLATQAAFVLHETARHDFVAATLGATIINAGTQAAIDDADWKRHFAAMHFHVRPADALQVLMGNEVRQALVDGDLEAMTKMASEGGFHDVCEEVLREESGSWANDSAKSIANAGYVLGRLGVLPGTNGFAQYLKRAFEKVPTWYIDTKTIGEGLVSIIASYEGGSREQRLRELLLHLTPIPMLDDATAFLHDEEEHKKWVDGIVPVLKWAREEFSDRVESMFTVPGSAASYSVTVLAASKLDAASDLMPLFRPQADRVEIMTLIAKGLLSETEADEAAILLTKLYNIDVDWPLDALIALIASPIADPAVALSISSLNNVMRILIGLALDRESKVAEARITDLLSSGLLLHKMWEPAPSAAMMATGLFATMLWGNELTTYGGNGPNTVAYLASIKADPSQTQFGPILSDVANLFVRHARLAQAITTCKATPVNNALVSDIFSRIGRIVAFASDDYLAAFFGHYSFLKQIFQPAAFDEILSKIIQVAGAEARVIEMTFTLDDFELYTGYLNAQRSLLHAFGDYLFAGTIAVRKQEWQKQLTADGPAMKLLLPLRALRGEGWLGDQFQDALVDHARAILDGAVPVNLSREWAVVVQALEPKRQSVLLKNIRDEVLSSDVGSNALQVLKLYQNEFESSTVLDEDADRIVRLLFVKFVQERNEEGLVWATAIVSKRPAIKSRASSDSIDDLTGRLRDLSTQENISDELRHAVERLGAALR